MTTWTHALHHALAEPAPRRRPVALARGAILRLAGASGTTVRAASGRVWITEERRTADAVLTGGAEHRIAGNGRVVVAADRSARVVLEWPSQAVPRHAEVAPAEGERGTPLPMDAARAPMWLQRFAAWLAAPELRDFADDHSPERVRDRLAAREPLLRA